MSTQRHPVLIWTDATGHVTAALVGDHAEGAAHAATETEALRELKNLLNWRAENTWWGNEADFDEPALTHVKVEVRPQYELDQRVLPCPETVWIKVPCVTGRQENGMRVAAIPHLGLRFDYQDAAALKSLVAHFVKESLHGKTPLQLSAFLPPADCRLTELAVRETASGERARRPEQRPELKPLFAIAEPLLQDAGRGRFATSAFGRETLVQNLMSKLSGEKTSLLLVGEPGVGKSTVLLDAVKRLTRRKADGTGETVADDLRAYRYWRGGANRIIAGMRYLGEWEERCEEFIQLLANVDGTFCSGSLLELIQIGGAGPGDSVGAFLLPYLQRNELRMIAEATPTEVAACRRLLPSLLDAFQIIEVPAFDDDGAVAVLGRIVNACAASARLEVEPGVAALVHRLFRRFQPYAVFPGPAARFLRGLCDRRRHRDSVGSSEVVEAFQKLTGLREVFLRDEEPLNREQVETGFAAEVIGQPEATRTAAQVVSTIKAGLTDPRRPFGVLLFCGPTGVGKTELVKSLARFCFGAGDSAARLVRLDMSEYSGWGAGRRLLENSQGGAAPWIERVRQQPFSVVLFDEVEKAAPEVFDVLLGLLDEGRLSDRFGRVTQFRSSIVVMTSNLGASATGAMGFAAGADPDFSGAVAKFFRPEFFNRLDAVVAFQSLTPDHVRMIARKELQELEAREGFAASGIRLEWSDDVIDVIARAGYDHQFGARPLQRVVEQLVAVPLARWRVTNPSVRDKKLRIENGADGLSVKEI